MTNALVQTYGPRGLVYREVDAERERQDLKWGGPTHDDEHDPEDWIAWIEQRCARADEMVGCPEEEWPPDGPDAEYRRNLVQIAALAVAAIESLDRIKGRLATAIADRGA